MPNRLSRKKDFIPKLTSSDIPSTEDAFQQFSSRGGRLKVFSPFGIDPLEGNLSLTAQRDAQFSSSVVSFTTVFHAIVNGDDRPFQDGLKMFIHLTEQLVPFV